MTTFFPTVSEKRRVVNAFVPNTAHRWLSCRCDAGQGDCHPGRIGGGAVFSALALDGLCPLGYDLEQLDMYASESVPHFRVAGR